MTQDDEAERDFVYYMAAMAWLAHHARRSRVTHRITTQAGSRSFPWFTITRRLVASRFVLGVLDRDIVLAAREGKSLDWFEHMPWSGGWAGAGMRSLFLQTNPLNAPWKGLGDEPDEPQMFRLEIQGSPHILKLLEGESSFRVGRYAILNGVPRIIRAGQEITLAGVERYAIRHCESGRTA